jgi:hypothetical protein
LIDTEGIVVSRGGPHNEGKLTHKLIIDPDTSHVLARQANVGEDADPVSGTLILRSAGPTKSRASRRP